MRQLQKAAAVARRGLLRTGRFGQNRSAVVALEFGILAIPFLVLALGTIEIGYDFYVQAELDNAVQIAARGVQVGSSVRGASQSLSSYVQQSVCPALSGGLNCASLYVSITAIPSGSGQNYASYLNAHPLTLAAVTNAKTNVVCTGTAGQLMLVRAFYLSPTFLGLLVPGLSVPSPVSPSVRVHASFASAGFVNEQFSGGQTGC
jgi:pilus assembly protein Flp/PilA